MPPPDELVRKKQPVTIRLDADIVEWFKEQGGQYQTVINEVLRRYKDHFSDRRAERPKCLQRLTHNYGAIQFSINKRGIRLNSSTLFVASVR